jgi:antitoxin ParD1/3/4
MATMNISLPDQMKEWVEKQTETGQYANSSDYVRDLIRKDREKREKIDALQIKINEGLASGESTRSLDDIFENARVQAITKGAR